MVRPQKLTRGEFAEFLNTQRKISAFENLFDYVDDLSLSESINDALISAPSDGDLLSYSSAESKWVNISGASGTFTSADAKTVTVSNGIITNIT